MPIYLCLIRFSWNLNTNEQSGYENTISGFINFNELLKQNEKNVTLSLDDNDRLLLQFNFNFAIVEEDSVKAKLFAMKNLTMNFQLRRHFFMPSQPSTPSYAHFMPGNGSTGFEMPGYVDTRNYSQHMQGFPIKDQDQWHMHNPMVRKA